MASAAEWMKFAAHLLWQQALDWDNPTSDKSGPKSSFVWDWGAPTGVMYGGEPGMHMDRWMQWYATLRTIINSCNKLEEAKLVVHYAQVTMAAMGHAMGVPESDLVWTDQSSQSHGSNDEATGYMSGEDTIIIGTGIANIRLDTSGSSEYDAGGKEAEETAGLILEPTVFRQEVVSSETASSKKADDKTEEVAKGKQTIKSKAFL